jgi:transposase
MSGVFVPVDRDQTFLLAFDFRVLLGEDHLVWTVIDVVESLDLSMLYARYGDHPDGGRPAFDPKMMLSLLVYAYCHGLRSSRQIEGACRTDFVYRAITANQEPDHATIARFRASLDSFLASLFSQVLSICRELGLGKVGLVAIDGTRMEASASKEANRTRSRLLALEAEAREMLSEAEAADSAEPSLPGGEGAQKSA